METRRWTNQSLPQTLQIGVFLLYANALFGLILRQSPNIGAAIVGPHGSSGLADLLNTLGLLFIVGGGAYAGYMISAEKKIGWQLGLVAAALPLIATIVIPLRFSGNSWFDDPIGLMFEIALLALLLHQQSRSYIRIWFK